VYRKYKSKMLNFLWCCRYNSEA